MEAGGVKGAPPPAFRVDSAEVLTALHPEPRADAADRSMVICSSDMRRIRHPYDPSLPTNGA